MSLSINPKTTKAILVGVRDYEHLPEVTPAKQVINDLKKALMNENILGLTDKNIITVIDKRHDEIEAEIHDFFEIYSGNNEIETLLFYYVGHGHRTKEGNFYLTGKNSKTTLKSSLLPFDTIKERLEASHLQQRIIFLDACYSGEGAMSAENDADLDIKGSYILTATDRNEKAFFDTSEGTKHTYFAAKFLDILHSGIDNANGFIDLESLFKAFANYHPKCTPQRKHTLNTNAADFYLFHNSRFDEFEILFKDGEKLLDKLDFEKAEAKFLKAARLKESDSLHREKAEAKIKECDYGLRLSKAIQQKIDRQHLLIKNKAEKDLEQNQKAKKTQLNTHLQNFVESQKGQWNTLEWIDFKETVFEKLACVYKERFVAELLEQKRSNFLKITKVQSRIINTIIGNFIFVKGGTFLMGSPEDEPKRIAERETQHEVKVSDFYIGETIITQGQWQSIMGNNPSHFKNGDNYPVEYVSWEDIQEFIQKINVKFKNQYTFKLPTEAQWEYACRAGTTTPFNTGENLTTKQANYDGNNPYNGNPKGDYLKQTTPVSKYAPNTLGLFDMHGNVWEWCEDWYQEWYYEWCKKQDVVENPVGPTSGNTRVLRGGSWDYLAQYCRSASRITGTPAYRNGSIGFRLVCSPVS